MLMKSGKNKYFIFYGATAMTCVRAKRSRSKEDIDKLYKTINLLYGSLQFSRNTYRMHSHEFSSH